MSEHMEHIQKDSPSLSEKMRTYTHLPRFIIPEEKKTTPDKWREEIQENVKYMRKARRKFGSDRQFDITDSLMKRREEAIGNTIEKVLERYGSMEPFQEGRGNNELVRFWIRLNLGVEMTYGRIERHAHILYAAAIWMLENTEDSAEKLDSILPYEVPEALMTEPEIRHLTLDEDQIRRAAGVLYNRCTDAEPVLVDSDGIPHVITGEALARGRQKTDGPHRRAFDALLSGIPESRIQEAVEEYRRVFLKWTDIYFARAGELEKKHVEAQKNADRAAKRLEMLPKSLDRDLPERSSMAPSISPQGGNMEEVMKYLKRKWEPAGRFGSAGISRVDVIPMLRDAYETWLEMSYTIRDMRDSQLDLLWDMVNSGGEETVGTEDPCGVCFALLYLLDEDDDMPWLMGPGIGVMMQVCRLLPWAPVSVGKSEEKKTEEEEKEVLLPSLYALPCAGEVSCAQMVYRETGWIMPANLHARKELYRAMTEKYGADTDISSRLLPVLCVLRAVSDREEKTREKQEKEAVRPEKKHTDLRALQAEVLRLKNSEHEALRRAEETGERLEEVQAENEMIRRELADLREIVFRQDNPGTEDREQENNEKDESAFPYEVQHNTVVFGGHDTWLKAIRGRFQGNIRFISRDSTFDTVIIRRAEAVWIQPNALSHAQFYRIIDEARLYRKPVHYFKSASALKSALQLKQADEA